METSRAGFGGHPPSVLIKKSERAKYEEIWREPEYRSVSPGEHYVDKFLQHAKPKTGETVIDFGCGTGRAGVRLNGAKLDVTMMDFASNCLDEWVVRLCDKYSTHLRFVRHDLTVWPFPVKQARYGYCTDVLEHLAPGQVDIALWNIVRAARYVFFAISTKPDNLGGLTGEPLHLTVEGFDWWKARFEGLRCDILWSEDPGNGEVFFYVTAFANAKDLHEAMVLNVDEETIKQQIIENLRLGLQEVSPRDVQENAEVILLAGGPSLNDFAEEIYQKAAAGVPVVTVNGTYKWALDHQIRPAATILLDGREFNRRFVEPIVPGCKYLLCSQCHPSLVKSIPAEQVWLWHSGSAVKVREAIDEYVRESGVRREWWPVYGGSTVVLRGVILLRMLGFKKLHLYGFDSCLRGVEHHAYAQVENDSNAVTDIEVGGRTFQCHPWMWSQAHEFMDLMRALGDEVEMEVYGDGLIAHIIATAAEMPVSPFAVKRTYRLVDTEESSIVSNP